VCVAYIRPPLWSSGQFLATDPDVPSSIPGSNTFLAFSVFKGLSVNAVVGHCRNSGSQNTDRSVFPQSKQRSSGK
jgi:hypothetical protein